MPQHREISLIRYLHKPPNQREEIQNKPQNPLKRFVKLEGDKKARSHFFFISGIWSGTMAVGQKILIQNEGLFFFWIE